MALFQAVCVGSLLNRIDSDFNNTRHLRISQVLMLNKKKNCLAKVVIKMMSISMTFKLN